MLAAMASGDDALVRGLLDQRAQRADIPPPQPRYSVFSDRSDSPSLYSHFSNARNTPTTPAPAARFPQIDVHDVSDAGPAFSLSERLADPNASSLDLSSDTASDSGSRLADPDDAALDEGEGEEEQRLSLLGPKVRVHSRAPWETGEDEASDSGQEDSGIDGLSIFGGKNRGRGVMRGLGFGSSKSPDTRPSVDSTATSWAKRSFETTSSVAGGGSRSAIHALAQASMSTSSLALGPSPSASRFPLKFSSRQSSRDRSGSSTSATSETRSVLPPLPSPRLVIASEKQLPIPSPLSSPRHRNSSPDRTTYPESQIRSPSRESLEGNGNFFHPYANPDLLPPYTYEPEMNAFGKDASRKRAEQEHMMRSDSLATLAASEETVMLSQSSMTNSASMFSYTGTDSSTTASSTMSLGSSPTQQDMSRNYMHEADKERAKQQKRAKRETKLGPISGPTMLSHGDFPSTTPYTLITLEQAQARAKEKSRNASPHAGQNTPVPFPREPGDDLGALNRQDLAMRIRARTSSGSSKANPFAAHDMDSERQAPGDHPMRFPNLTHSSPGRKTDPNTEGQPPVRTIRTKRSGFMKLFNAKEKEKMMFGALPPPVPSIKDAHLQFDTLPKTSSSPKQVKMPTHRVPVPNMPSAVPGGEVADSAPARPQAQTTKRTAPTLSIKVTSPPMTAQSRAPGVTVSLPDPKSFGSPKASADDGGKLLSPSSKPPSSAPASTTQFPALSLRPVSSFFTGTFAEHLLPDDSSPNSSSRNGYSSALTSPTSIDTDDTGSSPVSAIFSGTGADSVRSYPMNRSFSEGGKVTEDDQSAIIESLREQIRSSRKLWQQQIWELEGQVKDLKTEIDNMRAGDACDACGRGRDAKHMKDTSAGGVLNRPRAKTGHGARFGNGKEA